MQPEKAGTAKTALDLIWAIWCLLLSGFWVFWWVKLGKDKKEFRAIALVISINSFFEAMFFLCKTIYNITAFPYVVYPWGMGMQLVNGSTLWLQAFFWSRVGEQYTTGEVIKRAIGLVTVGIIFAIMFMSIVNFYGDDAKGLEMAKPIFLAWFEPPQLLILAFSLRAASMQASPANPVSLFVAGFLTIFVAHLGSMYIMGKNPCKMADFYPFYIPLQVTGAAIAAVGLSRALSSGVFERNNRVRDFVLAKAGIDHSELQQKAEVGGRYRGGKSRGNDCVVTRNDLQLWCGRCFGWLCALQ
jgi:hypothetical protein